MKIAGAPISWGVCEVPNWGYQMSPERVLTEMKEIGLTATEFGPQGWLPVEAQARAEAISKFDLKPVGAFFLAIMHAPNYDPMPAVEKELEAFRVAGGEYLILACDSGREGYDNRPVLDDEGWKTLFHNLDRIKERAAKDGVTACVHPHWGTMIQNVEEVEKMMAESSIGLCLDTGHLAAGGADIVKLTQKYADRVDIVHAKDIHKDMTDKLLPHELTWSEGVRAGMFAPIGEGDIDFRAVVDALNEAGFDGYYVLEQDIMIDGEPEEGKGPIEMARRSYNALKALA